MRFRDSYYFLSNMFPAPVTVVIERKPYTFSCAEAAFQAFKCPARAAEFTGLNGFEAKKKGRWVPLRPDWDDVRLPIMRCIVRKKFQQNPELLAKLRGVNGEIVEDNTWKDCFWGRCNGIGENHLGKILMSIRDNA